MSLSHKHTQSSAEGLCVDQVKITDGYDPQMDTGPYMNATMRAYFYGQLSRQAAEISNDLTRFAEAFRQNANPPDVLDRSSVAIEQATAKSHIEKQRKLRDKINGILREMRDRGAASEYGYCEESGKEIGVGRLMAKPWATKTIDEQERADRLQKLTARPRL